jgi:hypothetical protein
VWAIFGIHACEFERPSAVVAAVGVELRGMVREGEQMFPEPIETR